MRKGLYDHYLRIEFTKVYDCQCDGNIIDKGLRYYDKVFSLRDKQFFYENSIDIHMIDELDSMKTIFKHSNMGDLLELNRLSYETGFHQDYNDFRHNSELFIDLLSQFLLEHGLIVGVVFDLSNYFVKDIIEKFKILLTKD